MALLRYFYSSFSVSSALSRLTVANGTSISVRNSLQCGFNRYYFSSSVNHTTVSKPQCKNQEYEVTFVKANGESIKGKGKEGDTLLDVIVNNNLDFDGYGACEGTLTCSTCHVILNKEDYDRLPDKPSDEELDMLDLAYELTDTSRLGCQIHLTKNLNGLKVRVPATVNDARS